ncbi:MAG: insulinase family protein [Schlesneria sp.]|nr:insulinase family protein [Schlesneria sp.]
MRGRWIFGLVVALGTAVTAWADDAPKKIGSVEGFTEYQFPNGVKLVVFVEPSKPKLTVNMTVLVGSRHEGYGEAGMAHLLEHMLFKPTATHPQPDRDLQERGADYNGTTWVDRTNYYETLPASDENLEFAIAWEADRLMNCPIKAEDLASEMTVVRNEFEMGENSPKGVLEQRMFATAFEWHNYGKSTIGNRADIERVPADSLRAFYKKYYRPDNIVLFVGGRIDEAKAVALVQKYFGPLKAPEEPIRSTYTEEPAQDGERLVTLRRVGKVAVASVVYHIPAASDPDFAAVSVLEAIISADKTGRLYKSLVETKRAAKIEGVAYPWHDPSGMIFSAEVAAGNDPNIVAEGLLDTVQGVVEKPATEEEVERAKRTLLKIWDQQSIDTPKFLVGLTEWTGAGDWRLAFLFRDRLDKVTVADVNRVAKKYLQTTNRTVGVYVPTTEPQRTPVAATPDIAALVKDYKGRPEFSVGEVFDPSPEAIEARVKRSTIEGVKSAVLTKKNRGGSVVLKLNLRYGTAKSLFGLSTPCSFLPELMTRGTKKMTSEQLQDRLDSLQTTLVASGRPGEAEFTMLTKREYLVEALAVLKQVLREPTLPEAEFDVMKQHRHGTLEEQSAEPQALAPRAVQQKLSPYPVGDVRYAPGLLEELKTVDDMELSTVKKIYDDFLGASNGELAIVGDFDEKTLTAALTDMLVGWKSKQSYERITRSADKLPVPEMIKIRTPDKANAMYFAGQVMPLSDESPDYPALIIGNDVLGGSGFASRLMGRIREKEGLSYGVGSVFRAMSLDKRATLSIYAIANNDNIGKVVTLAREETERMLKDGLTEEELNESKRGYLTSQQASRGDDSRLVQVLADALFTGRTLKFQASLEDAVKKLTREQVQAAMQKHIDPSRLVNAVAGDLPESK